MEKIIRARTPWVLLGILALSAFLFLFKTGDRTLWDPDEGRYAEMIREMRELHDWITPHLNYAAHLDKPPLFLWLGALSTSLFGNNEWGLRFVCGVAGLGGVLTCFLLARYVFGFTAAVFSSLILASSFGYFGLSRLLSTDITLCLFISLAIYFLYTFLEEPHPRARRWRWWGAYISMGLGFLTKGIIAFAFPLAIFFGYFLLTKQLKKFWELKIFRGLLVVTLVAAPWIILVTLKNKNFLYYFFVDQHFLRFFTEKHKRTEGFFFPLLMALGGFGPWSFLVPAALLSHYKSHRTKNDPDKNPLLFFGIWILFVLVFFTFSKSKLPTYIGPLFLPLAIFVGKFWADLIENGSKSAKSFARHLLGLNFLAFVVVGGIAVVLSKKVPGSGLHSLMPIFLISMLFLPACVFMYRRKMGAAFLSILVMELMLFVYGVEVTLPYMDRVRETESACQKVLSLQKQNELIFFYEMKTLPSALYYCPVPKIECHNREHLRKKILSLQGKRFFILVSQRHYKRILKRKWPFAEFVLFSNLRVLHKKGSLVVLSNKP